MEAKETVRPRYQTVAIAAVELVERIRQLFPEAVIRACEPFEDEDICLMVYGPWEGEELEGVRRQIYGLEFELYRRYEVEAIVKALPLSYMPESEAGAEGN